MKFGEAVRHCLRNMFVFEGRARRSEFWWYYLFVSIIGLVVATVFVVAMSVPIIAMLSEGSASRDPDMTNAAIFMFFVLYGLYMLFALLVNVAMLGAMARRLHDTGQSGHWLWLNLAGLGIVPLIMCVMDGQPHENQWGPGPKAAEREALASQYAAWPAQQAQQGAYPPPPTA